MAHPSTFSLSLSLLSDKTVKLWKLAERRKRAFGFNLRDDEGQIVDGNSIDMLLVPRYRLMEDMVVEPTCRRVFANAHAYHINSVSVNSDGENFMSADDLRINLWNLEVSDQCFSKKKSSRKYFRFIWCFRRHCGYQTG